MEFTELLLGYNKAEELKFTAEMSGWVSFQPILAKVTEPEGIRKRITFEIENKRREYIIHRLIQRYNKLQGQRIFDAWEDYKNR